MLVEMFLQVALSHLSPLKVSQCSSLKQYPRQPEILRLQLPPQHFSLNSELQSESLLHVPWTTVGCRVEVAVQRLCSHISPLEVSQCSSLKQYPRQPEILRLQLPPQHFSRVTIRIAVTRTACSRTKTKNTNDEITQHPSWETHERSIFRRRNENWFWLKLPRVSVYGAISVIFVIGLLHLFEANCHGNCDVNVETSNFNIWIELCLLAI